MRQASGPLQRAIDLAESGRCAAALPLLQSELPRSSNRDLRLRGGLDALKCAMTMNNAEAGVRFLLPLEREFPNDPEVLYVATHVYSSLAEQMSQRLITTAPGSYQVHELNAEALEVQGKWDQARDEYRLVLNRAPNLLGIHYRIGRSFLSQPGGTPQEQAQRAEQARVEFEQELKLDPTNAGAEFVLGELAEQKGDYSGAAPHFARAAELNPDFIQALIASGEVQVHLRQYGKGLPPLLRAEKMQPQNPTVHFLLARAYMGQNDKEKQDREVDLYQKTQRQTQLTREQIKQQLLAGELPPAAQP